MLGLGEFPCRTKPKVRRRKKKRRKKEQPNDLKKKMINKPYENLRSRRRYQNITHELLFRLFVLLSVVTFCDSGNSIEDPDLENQNHDLSSSADNRAKVAESLPNLVVASRWQNELFLPCKFDHLAADHTVSI